MKISNYNCDKCYKPKPVVLESIIGVISEGSKLQREIKCHPCLLEFSFPIYVLFEHLFIYINMFKFKLEVGGPGTGREITFDFFIGH
jgi:hypothetical protein